MLFRACHSSVCASRRGGGGLNKYLFFVFRKFQMVSFQYFSIITRSKIFTLKLVMTYTQRVTGYNVRLIFYFMIHGKKQKAFYFKLRDRVTWNVSINILNCTGNRDLSMYCDLWMKLSYINWIPEYYILIIFPWYY